VTELEKRRALVNNEDKVSCSGCGSQWWFQHTALSMCNCAGGLLCRIPASPQPQKANVPLDTQPLQKTISL